MIVFSSAKGAACKVSASAVSFFAFPDSPVKGEWSLLSHPKEELTEKVLSWPGEYDFQDITIRAIGQEAGKQISYAMVLDGVRIAFIDAPVYAWSDTDIESIGDIDVLVIAAEDVKKVNALVEAIDPRILILFDCEGGKLDAVAKAEGKEAVESVSEFKVKPGSLPADTRQVVVLK